MQDDGELGPDDLLAEAADLQLHHRSLQTLAFPQGDGEVVVGPWIHRLDPQAGVLAGESLLWRNPGFLELDGQRSLDAVPLGARLLPAGPRALGQERMTGLYVPLHIRNSRHLTVRN